MTTRLCLIASLFLAACGGVETDAPYPADEAVLESELAAAKPPAPTSCVVGGCNGELCAPELLFSACVAPKPREACLPFAVCEVQNNGKCGFTETAEFKACLNPK